jgi:hypothetical protein
MKLIEVTALCRSGHHAVLNWIIRNMCGQQCTWAHKMNLMDNGLRILSEANHDIHLSYQFIEEQLKYTNLLIAGYEDTPWNYTIFSDSFIYKGPSSLETAISYGFKSHQKIVVVRDFYSNLSSRIKSNENKKFKKWNDKEEHLFDVGNEYVNRWKNLARSCVNEKVSFIKFEDWITNESVRKTFLMDNFQIKDIYGTSEIIGTNSSFGDKEKVKDRMGEVEIPEDIKEIIRKDNELHYLIGALGYKYREI